VWTPLIPATFPAERVQKFGQQTPMGRAAQPDEIAPSYVFLRRAAVVQLLLRRGADPDRRRDPARLIRRRR